VSENITTESLALESPPHETVTPLEAAPPALPASPADGRGRPLLLALGLALLAALLFYIAIR